MSFIVECIRRNFLQLSQKHKPPQAIPLPRFPFDSPRIIAQKHKPAQAFQQQLSCLIRLAHLSSLLSLSLLLLSTLSYLSFNMCGITAYLGSKKAAHILLSGLARLEYRGYDSAAQLFKLKRFLHFVYI